jgi:hypothetical protein
MAEVDHLGLWAVVGDVQDEGGDEVLANVLLDLGDIL